MTKYCVDCIIGSNDKCSGCSGTPVIDSAIVIYDGMSLCAHHLKKRAGLSEHKHD